MLFMLPSSAFHGFGPDEKFPPLPGATAAAAAAEDGCQSAALIRAALPRLEPASGCSRWSLLLFLFDDTTNVSFLSQSFWSQLPL